MNADSGFYLSVARDIYCYGENYYLSANAYSPLGMYLLGIPFLFFNSINSPIIFLVIVFVFNLVNGFFFYQILRYLNIEKLNAGLHTSFFVLYIFLMEGSMIILEPFVLFFILTGLLALLHRHFFMAGFLVFLSFYSKQYALFVLPGFLLYPLMGNNFYHEKVKCALKVVLGFLIPFIILLILIGFLYSYDFNKAFLKILGITSVGSDATGHGYSYKLFIYRTIQLLIGYPLLFFWIYFTFQNPKNTIKILLVINKSNMNILLLFLLLLAGSLFQLYFAANMHYFILIIPWILLITALIQKEFELRHPKREIVFTIVFFISLLLAGVTTKNTIDRKLIAYKEQVLESQFIGSVIPKGSKVQIQRLTVNPAQFFLLGYHSSNSSKLGYGFDVLYDAETTLNRMDSGSFYICKKELQITNWDRIESMSNYVNPMNLSDSLIIYKIGIKSSYH